MTQVLVFQDSVPVSAANAFALDEAAFFEILNNSLHSTLGNAHVDRDFSQDRRFVRIQKYKHVRVVCEKSPAMCGARWLV